MNWLDGHTTTHRVSLDTVIWKILEELENGMDVVVSFNGQVVGMHDTMRDIGIEHCGTLRCAGRLRGGAQRFRQQQPDIPGQWTCSVCGQERVWPVRNRCFRCGCPKGHDPAPFAAPCLLYWSRWSASPEVKHREPDIPAQPKATPTKCSRCFGAEFSGVGRALAGWSGCYWRGASAVLREVLIGLKASCSRL